MNLSDLYDGDKFLTDLVVADLRARKLIPHPIHHAAYADGSLPDTTAGHVHTRRHALRWADLFGIDPNYTEGASVEDWLEANRGQA